ncbi:CRISPR system precrRNA processing endoribonuclease RAMP protein Cas6 [Roseomonas sp. AR75]|uniref:CRISPR system precrRNA processing endoribonuclease RAMP protein Cas6 n=1 Tax=Roseomonas sp. AR75 TaxID=2562311 RepID=UPI001485295C|nr:CRISPR system precrRNA processing endoribonuclease RAMP protein Cas6 [Roseomonas sp. AR75]
MTSSSSELVASGPLTQGEVALGELHELVRDLAAPQMVVGIPELAELWTYEVFRFTCARPGDMEDYPELSERLRGAFGAALHRQPQPMTATGRLRPHAVDVLFRQLPSAAGEDETAKPALVRGWIEGAALIAELRIFGCAIAWRDEAATAMLDALQEGVALRGAPRAQRRPVTPSGVVHRRVSCLDIPASAAHGMMRFRSPVTVRQRGVAHARPDAVFGAALRRVDRMARWQGCRLLTPDDWLARHSSGLDVATRYWREVSWERFTRNQGDTPVPMRGHLGELTLDGDLGELAPLLMMAETCNIGSHAALGMGWFDWIVW